MVNPNIYYYLLLAISDSEKAPVYYAKYLLTKENEDYGTWVETHMFSLGLAIAADYKMTFFPKEINEILEMHRKTDDMTDIILYTDIMEKVRIMSEKVLLKEIIKNKITKKSEKVYSQILETDEKYFINLFKKYVELVSKE